MRLAGGMRVLAAVMEIGASPSLLTRAPALKEGQPYRMTGQAGLEKKFFPMRLILIPQRKPCYQSSLKSVHLVP